MKIVSQVIVNCLKRDFSFLSSAKLMLSLVNKQLYLHWELYKKPFVHGFLRQI